VEINRARVGEFEPRRNWRANCVTPFRKRVETGSPRAQKDAFHSAVALCAPCAPLIEVSRLPGAPSGCAAPVRPSFFGTTLVRMHAVVRTGSDAVAAAIPPGHRRIHRCSVSERKRPHRLDARQSGSRSASSSALGEHPYVTFVTLARSTAWHGTCVDGSGRRTRTHPPFPQTIGET
jgi:hypothetical protein